MKKKIFSVLSLVMALITVMSAFAAMTVSAAQTVKVAAPVVTELTATCTSVTIKWEEHNDDDMTFLVYRSATGKAGTWKKLAQTKAGATSYTDKTAAPAQTYVYTVKTYYKGKDGTVYLSDMSGKHVIKTGLERPVFKLAGNSGNGVLLQWNTRADSTGFIIYKSETGKAGSWSRIKVVNSNKAGSLTDSKVEIGKTYYYAIKAYKTIGSKNYYSATSKAYKLTIKDVAVPTGLSAVQKDDGVYFTLEKVPATKGYLIYRSETGEKGTWTRLTITKSNNTTGFIDTTAEKDKIYYYTAKSYKTVNGKNIYSDSATAVRTTNVETPVIKFEPTEITFKSFYEEIPVKLTVTGMKENDSVVMTIDGIRITDELLEDEDELAALVSKVNFFYYVDEDASTDETLVLNIYRLAPGSGVIKVEHSRYSDIYAELKVNCSEFEYDKDYATIVENVYNASEAADNAEDLLQDALAETDSTKKDAIIANAKKQLQASKTYFETANILVDKYYAEFKDYEDFIAEAKIIDDCLDAVNDAIADLTGDAITDANIQNALKELDIAE